MTKEEEKLRDILRSIDMQCFEITDENGIQHTVVTFERVQSIFKEYGIECDYPF